MFNRNAARNISYLYVLQICNYILPFVTLSYVTKVVGPEHFGEYIFVVSITSFIAILIDFGFNVTGTSEVARNRFNVAQVNNSFTVISYLKLLLAFMILSLVLLVYLIFGELGVNLGLFFVCFCVVCIQIIIPQWLLQGLEELRLFALTTIISKLFPTLGVFVFVKDFEDLIWYPILQVVGGLVAASLVWIVIGKKFGVRFVKINFSDFKRHLSLSVSVFISNVAISFYTISVPFALGLLSSKADLGYYGSAERLSQAPKGVGIPISQALFPVIAHNIALEKAKSISFAIQSGFVQFALTLFLGILLALNSDRLILLIFGREFLPAANVIIIMSIIPAITMISNTLGISIMCNIGMRSQFMITICVCAIFSLPLTLVLIKYFSAVGAAFAVFITEILVCVALYMVLWRKQGINRSRLLKPIAELASLMFPRKL